MRETDIEAAGRPVVRSRTWHVIGSLCVDIGRVRGAWRFSMMWSEEERRCPLWSYKLVLERPLVDYHLV